MHKCNYLFLVLVTLYSREIHVYGRDNRIAQLIYDLSKAVLLASVLIESTISARAYKS